MAAKKSASKKETNKETKKANFKEFKYSGKVFEYSGRVYPSKEGTGKIVRSWGMSLTLNDCFTLKGVRLVETESNVFLTYPQYKSDDKYNSYVFISEELNGEIDKLVEHLMKLLGIDDSGADDIAKGGETDLPF